MSVRMALLLVALAGTASCRLFQSPGPTAVAQGRYFSTGNPSYDEFFVRLYRMQVELKAAPETLGSIRRDLLRGVELPPTADDAELERALDVKATEMRGRGTSLAVERSRETGARPRLSVTGTPGRADEPLVKTLGEAVVRLGEVRERVGPWQKELEWLPQAGIGLDGSVEAAFVGESRATREDVHENLADGQKVVALMVVRVKEVDTNSAALEGLLASALGEKHVAPAEPAPAPAPAADPKPRTRPAPARRASAPAGAAPSKPSAPTDDEPAPAPKPKQGTAKPDFEP